MYDLNENRFGYARLISSHDQIMALAEAQIEIERQKYDYSQGTSWSSKRLHSRSESTELISHCDLLIVLWQ